MDLGLKGKVAIVTGGARGIGKGCSTALAMEGCNLAIVDLGHDETTRAYMEELKKEYEVDVLELAADVSNEEQIQQVYKDTLEHYGKIDILINNAEEALSENSSTSLRRKTGDLFRKLH